MAKHHQASGTLCVQWLCPGPAQQRALLELALRCLRDDRLEIRRALRQRDNATVRERLHRAKGAICTLWPDPETLARLEAVHRQLPGRGSQLWSQAAALESRLLQLEQAMLASLDALGGDPMAQEQQPAPP